MSYDDQVSYQQAFKGTPVLSLDKCQWVTVVNTVAASSDLITGDYYGASSDAMDFSATDLDAGCAGMIIAAILEDNDVSTDGGEKSCELWLFDTEPTPPVNSAAWSISDAMAKTVIGVIPFSTYYSSALNGVAKAENLTIPFKFAASANTLYGCIVCRATTEHSANALTVRLFMVQMQLPTA